jgi:hypothetical protein
VYGLRLLRQRPVQIAALTVVLVVVLALRALQFSVLTGEIQWGYDFSAYWAAAHQLNAGTSPYTPLQLEGPYAPQRQFLYLYPPPLAAVMTPLAALFSDYRVAAWVWAAIGALLLIVSIRTLARSERIGERYPLLSGRGRWLLVAAAFAFPPVVGELVMGNVHFLLLWLLTLAWLGIARGDPVGRLRGGALAGIAAVVKVFPGLLLLWALLARAPRVAIGLLIGAGLAALLALPLTGVQPWLQYPTVLANLAAPSDTTDTLAPTVWLAEWLDFTIARVIVTVIGLSIMAWSAWSLRRTTATGSPDETRAATARSYAVAVTVSVLIAPALYHHYLALLVLPLLIGLGAGVPLRYLAVAYFLMWGGQQDALGDLSWIVNRGMPTAGAIVLLVGLVRTPPTPAASLTPATVPAMA